MNAEKLFQETPSRTIQGKMKDGMHMADFRPDAIFQAKMVEAIQRQEDDDDLLQGKFVGQLQEEDDELLQGKFVSQMSEDDEELMQGKFVAQLQDEDDDELLQGKFAPVQRQTANLTGMPDAVKQRMEDSFDTDFSSVRVHPDSSKAPDVGALAYTQGSDIHFAPGQFKPDTSAGQQLLGHELTHVIQQAEGRVQPTTEIGGMAVNDDFGLENEADVLGNKAAMS